MPECQLAFWVHEPKFAILLAWFAPELVADFGPELLAYFTPE